MLNRSMRISLAVAGFGLLTLAVGPVLADTDLGHTGTVGMNSLTDTHSKPGAKCHYEGSGAGVTWLDSIRVRPPNMAPVPGRSQQVVGWQAIVQRRFVGSSTGPWKVVYTSQQQTTAIGGEGSGFDWITVPITLPANEGDKGEHFFRVKVKMFWYRKDDQTVQGTSLHRVDFYRELKGNLAATFDGSCGGLSFS